MSDAAQSGEPFAPGCVVLVTLNNPREKFWGAIISVNAAGVSVRGVDLNSFDDFARMIKAGEPVAPHAVFFPMHRIERMELDSRNGEIPSMQERFTAKAGKDFVSLAREADA